MHIRMFVKTNNVRVHHHDVALTWRIAALYIHFWSQIQSRTTVSAIWQHFRIITGWNNFPSTILLLNSILLNQFLSLKFIFKIFINLWYFNSRVFLLLKLLLIKNSVSVFSVEKIDYVCLWPDAPNIRFVIASPHVRTICTRNFCFA